jgi:CO/xanthine dehydrogenase Mo-binding subunit
VGVTLTTSTSLQDCLALLARHDLWREREAWKAAARSFKRRGVGLACVMHGMGYGPVVPDYGNAKIELTEQGTFRVFSGVVDMGQGNASTYLQIAGAILNQDADQMELVRPDTQTSLPSGSSSASRTTYTFGNALIGAALALKERLVQRAAALVENSAGDISDLAMTPGAIVHRKTGQIIPLSRLADVFAAAERVSVFNFQAPVASERPTTDENLQLHGIPHYIFSYGAHLACVEVDEITGKVEVRQYLAVSDCGRIINPQVFEQQIQGGIAQGLGYALYEDFIVENGRIATPDLSTYIIPTALDIPDLQSIAVEQPEETGPFGLKGAGEIGIDGPLPAVANAVADACGVRIWRSPLTAERVLQALAEKDGKGAGS